MRAVLNLMLLCVSGYLAAQHQTATVILKSGDTIYLQQVVQDDYIISGKDIKANKPRKIALAVVDQIINGCAYEKDEIDDMTGQAVRITKLEKIGGNAGFAGIELHIAGHKTNELTALKMLITYPEIFSLEKDAKILIKCDDNNVHELNNLEYTIARRSSSSLWNGQITLPLSEDMISILSACKATKIRLYLNSGYVELDIKENKQQVISRVVACVR
jgi:hypothetical protein